MLTPRQFNRIFGKIRELRKDKRGVSAVEFAFIAPVMVAAYLGGVEVSTAIAFNRKVTLASRALSDLVAQSQLITPTDVTNIFAAANQVLFPYNTQAVQMTVSSIKIDGSRNMTVVWSEKNAHGAAHTNQDTQRLIPQELRLPNTSLTVSEVTFNYQPTFFEAVIPSISLNETAIMRPRLVEIVCKQGQTVAQCSI
jgi:Flp pilus assembly protein TadG